MTTITTEIKHVENSFEDSNEFGIEINLEEILVKEYKLGLPHGLDTPY